MENRIFNYVFLGIALFILTFETNAQSSITSLIMPPSATVHNVHTTSKVLRLDILTESQIDHILNKGLVSLEDVCQQIMGCIAKEGDVFVDSKTPIRLFSDDRLLDAHLVELLDPKRVIGLMESTAKGNFINTDHVIYGEDLDKYGILVTQK